MIGTILSGGKNMKITYIHHSSFLIETDYNYLLFDYCEGCLPELKNKPLYIFSSHRHEDHFSPVIFDLQKKHQRVTYILSNDIPVEKIDNTAVIHWVEPYQQKNIDSLMLKTYRSNDEGVAFFLEIDGVSLYHAGDLNHWHWEAESDEWKQMIATLYLEELALIGKEKIKVAFIPLDSRLGSAFYLGIDNFMKAAGAEYIIPMHLWGDFEAIQRLKELPCVQPYKDRIIEIQQKGDCYDIN